MKSAAMTSSSVQDTVRKKLVRFRSSAHGWLPAYPRGTLLREPGRSSCLYRALALPTDRRQLLDPATTASRIRFSSAAFAVCTPPPPLFCPGEIRRKKPGAAPRSGGFGQHRPVLSRGGVVTDIRRPTQGTRPQGGNEL